MNITLLCHVIKQAECIRPRLRIPLFHRYITQIQSEIADRGPKPGLAEILAIQQDTGKLFSGKGIVCKWQNISGQC